MNKEIQVEATLTAVGEPVAIGMSKAARAGMSDAEWREATRFDSTDWGWIIMSIGMAIGAGIVFLPVQVGIVGVWVYLLAAAVGYPALYLFQRLFVNTLRYRRNVRIIRPLFLIIWVKLGYLLRRDLFRYDRHQYLRVLYGDYQ